MNGCAVSGGRSGGSNAIDGCGRRQRRWPTAVETACRTGKRSTAKKRITPNDVTGATASRRTAGRHGDRALHQQHRKRGETPGTRKMSRLHGNRGHAVGPASDRQSPWAARERPADHSVAPPLHPRTTGQAQVLRRPPRRSYSRHGRLWGSFLLTPETRVPALRPSHSMVSPSRTRRSDGDSHACNVAAQAAEDRRT